MERTVFAEEVGKYVDLGEEEVVGEKRLLGRGGKYVDLEIDWGE